jgi:Asp-tRNA(Asn)/Glu-tRNA(Gln) amidotransferase C subunit
MLTLRQRALRRIQDPYAPSQLPPSSITSIQQRFTSSNGNVWITRPSVHHETTSLRAQYKTKATPKPMEPLTHGVDIKKLLSDPLWSVNSLLPQNTTSLMEPSVTVNQLHHLLRLSALPQPESREEEREMLNTLSSQLHFVKEIQKVDTTDVKPMRAIRDETLFAEKETEITLATLKDALEREDVIGKHYKRIRRRQERQSLPEYPKGWRPLNHAQSKVGSYFVVDGGQKPTP